MPTGRHSAAANSSGCSADAASSGAANAADEVGGWTAAVSELAAKVYATEAALAATCLTALADICEGLIDEADAARADGGAVTGNDLNRAEGMCPSLVCQLMAL
jgi:hypothetical protein